MRRLLLVIGTLQGGGAERQLADMANYWAQCGVQVTLATWSGPEVPDFYALASEVRRVWLDSGAVARTRIGQIRGSVQNILRLRRLVGSWRPDAVLSFIDVSNVYTILATRGIRGRVVVAERTFPGLNRTIGRLWRVLRRVLYARADLVVTQTRAAGEWVERVCGAQVAVIPNALRQLPSGGGQREKLIIAVGRLSREKGIDVLLRAFSRIAAQFPDWRVCVIGDGAERDELLQLRERLHLSQRVEFIGEEREMDEWLARGALLVHASRREGFPNVVLEAMGMGMAVICTNCLAGPSDLIDSGTNGYLVPVDDDAAMAEIMRKLMTDQPARARIGLAASKVRQRFNQDLVMQQWDAHLFPARPEHHVR